MFWGHHSTLDRQCLLQADRLAQEVRQQHELARSLAEQQSALNGRWHDLDLEAAHLREMEESFIQRCAGADELRTALEDVQEQNQGLVEEIQGLQEQLRSK